MPNFSLWRGDPRLEHRTNISRTIRAFETFCHYGVVTRPHVSFFLNRDVEDWIDELRRWPELRTFSLDFATFKSDEDWNANMRKVRRLFEGIGPGYDVLANGVAKSERILELGTVIDRFTVVHEHSYHLAMARHMTRDELASGAGVMRTGLESEAIFRREVERTAVDARLAMLQPHRAAQTTPHAERVPTA